MKSAEILLYDIVGEDWWSGGGFTAKAFAETLQALKLSAGDELTLRVNSPGGDVFDGLAIYNTLLACPAHKIAKVEGLAASAASFLIQGCDEVQVAEASLMMIHRAWAFVMGNAEDMMSAAASLERDDGIIAAIYAKRTKKPVSDMLALMSAVSEYTGAEAIEAGLADKLIEQPAPVEETSAQARWDARMLGRIVQAPAARATRFARPPSPVRLAPAALIGGPMKPRAQADAMAACTDACNVCEDACQVAIAHCLTMGAEHMAALSALLDCIGCCESCGGMCSRGSASAVACCAGCAACCRACAGACDAFPDEPEMAACAAACRACADACDAMVGAAPMGAVNRAPQGGLLGSELQRAHARIDTLEARLGR